MKFIYLHFIFRSGTNALHVSHFGPFRSMCFIQKDVSFFRVRFGVRVVVSLSAIFEPVRSIYSLYYDYFKQLGFRFRFRVRVRVSIRVRVKFLHCIVGGSRGGAEVHNPTFVLKFC